MLFGSMKLSIAMERIQEMPALSELELWLREQRKAFKARMDATNPEHSRLYCEHGIYIGHNGIFREGCEQCVTESS
jgi:hypothetical protein